MNGNAYYRLFIAAANTNEFEPEFDLFEGSFFSDLIKLFNGICDDGPDRILQYYQESDYLVNRFTKIMNARNLPSPRKEDVISDMVMKILNEDVVVDFYYSDPVMTQQTIYEILYKTIFQSKHYDDLKYVVGRAKFVMEFFDMDMDEVYNFTSIDFEFEDLNMLELAIQMDGDKIMTVLPWFEKQLVSKNMFNDKAFKIAIWAGAPKVAFWLYDNFPRQIAKDNREFNRIFTTNVERLIAENPLDILDEDIVSSVSRLMNYFNVSDAYRKRISGMIGRDWNTRFGKILDE